MDIVSRAKRSQMMAAVRGASTKPELAVRRSAHALGYRFRLHRRDLPGSPDMVLSSRSLAVFVHGCYWHRHAGCKLCYKAKSNLDFWQRKFTSNVERDRRVQAALEELGWRVVIVWECETTDKVGLRSKIGMRFGA